MSAERTVIAKIARPRLALTYQRTDLHKLLDEMRSRQLIIISGPPGAGKSTLVATYVENRKLPSLWYQVDKCDKDIATVFHYLGIAAQDAKPNSKSAMPHLTPEFSLGISAFAKRFFRELYHHLEIPFLIVFDNYQDVAEDAVLHEAIRVACSELPPGGRIVLITRKECPPAMARLRAANMVALIEWEELQLSPSEVKAIAAMHGVMLPSDEAARQLQMRVGGWAAGLSLLLQTKSHANVASESPAELNSVVFDYFAEEVFNRLSPDIQSLMQSTAVLPAMSPQAVEELIGSPDAGRMVAQFAQDNYFTAKHGDQNPVYQYHPLFREFLLARAEAALPRERLLELRRHAARILVASGQLDDGVQMFIKVKDWESAAELICRHAAKLHEQGRHKTLETWLSMFPKEFVEERAWLSYWLGESLVFYDPVTSGTHFERAYALFQKKDDLAGVFLTWSGVMDSIFYACGDYAKAEYWIGEMDSLLAKYPQIQSPEIAGRVTFTMFTALMFWKPNHPHMALLEERVQQMIASNIDPTLRMLLTLHFAKYCLWRGDLAQASIILETQRGNLKKITAAPFAQVMWSLVDAFYAMHAGLHERCLQAVTQGLQLSRDTGIHMWDIIFLGHGATTSFSTNNLDAAGQYVKEMAAVLDKNGYTDASLYHAMAAWHAALTKQPGVAMKHAEFAIKLVERSGKPYFMSAFMLGMGLVHYWFDNVDTAEMYLRRAREIGEKIENSLLEWVYLLFAAYLAIDQKREEPGISLLRDALRLGREKDYLHFFFWPRAVISRLCGIAMDKDIEGEYVRRLVKQHNLLQDPAVPATDKWPYPVKVYTLGRFNVLKDETPIRFEGKAQRAPMNLLKALIAFGGRDVSEQRLANALWPDSDGDAGQQSLATSLFRLRKLIGNDTVRRQEGRLSIDPQLCWVDCWMFERLLSDTANDVFESCRMIQEIYHKPFLDSEDDAPWAVPMRERLHAKFINCFSNCGKELQRLDRHEEAICLYQRGLEIDDLAEGFYRGLMISYAAIGQKAESVRLYERALKVFRARLGVELSMETQRLLLSLSC